MKIPMSSPQLNDDDLQAVRNVLDTRYLALGPRLKRFEELVAEAAGCRFGVGVNSGTSGLHLAVIAAGIGEGDLVITTPFSFIASSNCILFERAIPIFVDIDPISYNIDPHLVQAAAADLVQGGKAADRWLPPNLRRKRAELGELKALLPVDAFGQPADYDLLQAAAGEFGLNIIEDSCEALGSEYKGRKAGTLGDAGVFAFYPNKQLTTGEGGMLVTDNEDWAALFRSLRNQGRDVFDAWLNHTRLGYNYRLDEMSAALGLSQLARIDQLIEARSRVAAWYTERLQDLPGLNLPSVVPETTRMSWFVFVVRVTGPVSRDQLMEELAAQEIPSRPYFTPIHLQPFYRERFGYQEGDFPETERAGKQCLALPFSSVMEQTQVQYVADAIRSILG